MQGRGCESGAGWRTALWIAGALAALAAVLVFASARHGTVALLYEESGNGCRTLTAASSAELTRTLVSVRILIGAWVVSTALPAVASVARSEPAWRARAAVFGAVAAVALAGANKAFIGTDLLSALLPLVLLWLSVGLAAVGLGVASLIRRHRRVARWQALYTSWLAVSGVALPLILLALTGDGAIHSC